MSSEHHIHRLRRLRRSRRLRENISEFRPLNLFGCITRELIWMYFNLCNLWMTFTSLIFQIGKMRKLFRRNLQSYFGILEHTLAVN